MGLRRPALLAWSTCFLVLALLVLSLWIQSLSYPGLHWGDLAKMSLLLVFAGVGAIVAARCPRNPIGWILCAATMLMATGSFALEYAVYALTAGPESVHSAAWMGWLGACARQAGWLLMVTFPVLLFPTGRLPSRRWRPVLWLAVSGIALVVLVSVLAPSPIDDRLSSVRNPMGVGVSPRLLDTLVVLLLIVQMLSVVGSAAAVLFRFQRAAGVERQQLKWFVYTAGLGIVGAVVSGLGFYFDLKTGEAPFLLAVLGIPIAIAIGILKYRLWDIDLIINRTLVYGALTMIVAAVYVLVVGGLGTLLQARGNVFISLLGAALVALIFAPLRQRLQAAVNRMMYGHRDEPELALSHLGRRLEAAVSPDAILPTIVHTVKDALRLPYAAIELREDASPDMERVVSAGSPPPNPVRLSLVYQGEWIGNLVVAPRVGEDGFTPADRHLLDDLVRQAGVAVHAVRLTTDLQRSRERLVTAREEERRRLRHDLHDGLGPALASMSLQVAAVRSLVADEPEASAMLTSLKTQMQEAVADVRRLVYALRPPTLDEFGLVQALREYAARYRVLEGGSSVHGEGLRVIVEAPGSLPAMSAAVETAVYRIALEAITNAARHSCAQCCTVHLSVVGTELQVEIADDGVGIPVEYRAGTGMISMRERARELGGSFDVRRADDGGTRVCARLPIGDSYE